MPTHDEGEQMRKIVTCNTSIVWK